MKCPKCSHDESKVIDSRPTDDNDRIRRRRECLNCLERFTTYESMEQMSLIVIKKDKTLEPFDREKLLRGLLIACANGPLSFDEIEKISFDIENSLQNSLERETTSTNIGELAMQYLKNVDEVSYIRFASVYREFHDINSFLEELKSLMKKKLD